MLSWIYCGAARMKREDSVRLEIYEGRRHMPAREDPAAGADSAATAGDPVIKLLADTVRGAREAIWGTDTDMANCGSASRSSVEVECSRADTGPNRFAP